VFSTATIDGVPYEVNEHTPPAIRQFLSQALSNSRYDSVEQLQHRAEVYLEHIDAEKRLIADAGAALHDPSSAAFQQATWMSHLERGLWKPEALPEALDREQLGNEVLGTTEPLEGSPYARPRPWQLSAPARSAFAMMVKGEAGPFTREQALAGFETTQEGLLIAGQLGIEERVAYRMANRHDAHRSRTHPTRTPDGLDLSQDKGTHLRDELRAPVMTGTSGSSSDVALATKHGAEQAGVSWAAPGLDESQAKAALVDISLQFFRSEGSNPPTVLAQGINDLRAWQGLPSKEVEASEVFTHSYPEIHAGVSLTLDGIDPGDQDAVEQAMLHSTMEAKDRLDARAVQPRAGSAPAPAPPVTLGDLLAAERREEQIDRSSR
jgi:hypothetical protein